MGASVSTKSSSSTRTVGMEDKDGESDGILNGSSLIGDWVTGASVDGTNATGVLVSTTIGGVDGTSDGAFDGEPDGGLDDKSDGVSDNAYDGISDTLFDGVLDGVNNGVPGGTSATGVAVIGAAVTGEFVFNESTTGALEIG